jgi:hypothetical protein
VATVPEGRSSGETLALLGGNKLAFFTTGTEFCFGTPRASLD